MFEPSKTDFEVTVLLERCFEKGKDRDFWALYRGCRDGKKIDFLRIFTTFSNSFRGEIGDILECFGTL